MEQVEIKYLDGEFEVVEEQPSTIAELVTLVGDKAVVDEATYNLRYRNKYPRVYKLVSKEVEGLGHARKTVDTKVLKDGTSKPILESFNDHLRGFMKDSTENKGILGEIFSRVASAEQLYVKGERTASVGGKISADNLETARGFFELGDEKVEAVIGKIEATVPGYTITRDGEGNATEESLARGIAALKKHIEKEAQAAAAAALAL